MIGLTYLRDARVGALRAIPKPMVKTRRRRGGLRPMPSGSRRLEPTPPPPLEETAR